MALRIWNPFKPHVAKLVDYDAYVVRRLTLWGWVYKDVDVACGWWSNIIYVSKYCIHYTPESAAEACVKKKPFARLYAY